MASTSPPISNRLLLAFISIAAFTGMGLDFVFGNSIDYWIHDSAVVSQARTQWKYVAVVALDENIPVSVSRVQALPLIALATERLVAAGAKGIFLDARVSKELEGRMPYAVCIEADGEVRWSEPQCAVTSANQCQVLGSGAGRAPLMMAEPALAHFSTAPFPIEQKELPDFLLFDNDPELISGQAVEASDRLATRNSPIARWIDLSDNHAVLRLAKSVQPERLQAALADTGQNEMCDKNVPCRRIRLSRPLYAVQNNAERLFLPLSVLAACNQETAINAAAAANNKAVIFQVTAPTETTDTLITPMTTAVIAPKQLTPGAQYLADAVETLLNQDYPRRTGNTLNTVLFIGVAIASVMAGAYLSQSMLWLVGSLIFSGIIAVCFINPELQLWPVTAALLTFVTGSLQTTGARLLIGFREGKIVKQYLPQQVHNLLLKLKNDENFKSTSNQVIVLMSDLEGYTTITGILKEPKNILNLMNDYLNETSLMLQDKYQGWLEAYVGDMVCYYWPVPENGQQQVYQNALNASLELAVLQQQFFASVASRYAGKFEPQVLHDISKTINAGIGLTAGLVVMGDLGPKRGVRKFGILGDPLNLASRIEALTRLFNTEIIVTGELAETAKTLDIPTRRLGLVCVKGRTAPAMLYALGHHGDERFSTENITAWENWLAAVEQQEITLPPCPAIYQQDQLTLENWLGRKLLTGQGVWHLQEK
ncbi:MAG: adenylate/guanylate cyclase domain-containing protein [Methylobacter sp.]|nr:adenylate/guanylate cyclase domain-containing protein [Methylobacter sp.]MDP2427941.1 adenylate/guanylate cyclase domain-containing protein [Methylobacter sp.]MDP3055836.1 adenylate/guanylate cyclase domain-containing protein [Methylobacter sp.]MDP3361663.1 adenylate/guanylate cyclase domain-containing protein [Methylobacter sp.]MDZ4221126.1 adenylate/guanylate cyclase domain-containing protein [Methylobacter sp.]